MSGSIAAIKANLIQLRDDLGGDECHWGVADYRDIEETGYDDGWEVDQNFTNDRDLLAAGVNAMTIGGGGDTEEEDLLALQMAVSSWLSIDGREGKRIIIWTGDAAGHEGGSYPVLDDVITALQDADINVLAVNVGNLDATGQATAITAMTSGVLISGTTYATLKNALCQILGN